MNLQNIFRILEEYKIKCDNILGNIQFNKNGEKEKPEDIITKLTGEGSTFIGDLLKELGRGIFHSIKESLLDKDKNNLELYFWPGYQSLKNKRIIISPDVKNSNDKENFYSEDTGIGFFQEDQEINEYFHSSTSYWYDAVLSKNTINLIQEKKLIPSTHSWSKQVRDRGCENKISTSLILKNNRKLDFLIIENTNENLCEVDNNCLQIKINKDNSKSWGKQIAEKINDLKNYKNINNDSDYIHWPQTERLDKNKDSKIIEFQTKLYSIWAAATFNNSWDFKKEYENIFKDSEGDYLILKNRIKKYIDDEEKRNSIQYRESKFTYWYTLFVSNSVDTDLGSAMILSNKDISKDILNLLLDWINLIYNEIRYLEANTIKEINASKAREESIKSAIATIMARNMSHNLGSHVLSALTINYNMPYDDVIFNQYLQHRMDFIAQITTDWPKWTYPVWFVRDLMRKFYMQTHLLNYIVESENLSAYHYQGNVNFPNIGEEDVQQNKLIIEIEKIDKTGNVTKIITVHENSAEKLLNNDLDIQVAIPGGTVGYHAFYVILENFIRNTAKHQWSKRKNQDNIQTSDNIINSEEKDSAEKINNENLVITIRIYDEEDKDCTRFFLYSNIECDSVTQFNEENRDVRDIITKNIDEKIQQKLINNDGKLLHKNWGLAEMKIALGYLNGKSPVYIGEGGEAVLFSKEKFNEDNTINGLICARKDEKNNKFWGHEFSIPKPKEVLIISDNKEIIDRKIELKKYNIHIASCFEQANTDFELAVIDGVENIKKLESNIIEQLPYRILITNNKEFKIKEKRVFKYELELNGVHDVTTANNFKLKVFNHWTHGLIKQNFGDKLLYIHGETSGKTKGSSPNKRLDEKALSIVLPKEMKTLKAELNNSEKRTIDTERKIDIVSDLIEQKSFYDIRQKMANLKKEKGNKVYIKYLYKQIENYRDIDLHFIFDNYEEDILTVPKPYRASSTEKAELGNDIFTNADTQKYPFLIHILDENERRNEDKVNKKNTIYYKRHATLTKDYYYAEALSGAQIYFNLLLNGNIGNIAKYVNTKILLQLLENSLSGILIIDERVHEYYIKADITIKNRWNCANIKSFNDRNIKDEEKLLETVKKNRDKMQFLIIHQGILDKVVNESNDSKEKDVIKNLLAELKTIIPFVVITSGRGRPDKIPVSEKFIPYSTISETLMSNYHEKFLLINILLKLTSSYEKN